MLEVFLTVDVEIWCDNWIDIDHKFPDAFCRYVYGPTSHGNFGLPYQTDILNSHGLLGVFFVEPLFAARFGIQPLAEIVSLIKDKGQEIQLHLHTEWVDEARIPLLPDVTQKRQHLCYFNQEEQTSLIESGLRLLAEAGAPQINAFRAGSFAFNKDTLSALAKNGIQYDSSYNASQFGLNSGVLPGKIATDVFKCDGILEYPMTIFNDGSGKLRHAQIAACSYQEMEGLLWKALEAGHQSFVILSHNFELLNRSKTKPDWIAVRRFEKLCSFLDKNRDSFTVSGFHGLSLKNTPVQPTPISSPRWKTVHRMAEQIYRRIYQ